MPRQDTKVVVTGRERHAVAFLNCRRERRERVAGLLREREDNGLFEPHLVVRGRRAAARAMSATAAFGSPRRAWQ